MSESRFRSLQDPETLRQLVRNLREGIYITNARGEILDANSALLEMFGVSSLEDLRGYRAEELMVDPAQRQRELELLTRDGAVRDFEFDIRRPDGEIRTVLDTCYGLRDPASGEILYHGVLIDITSRKELERRLMERSLRDALTGCHNRRYLPELEAHLRAAGETWAVIVADIDNFKAYNDRYGHQAGDEILVRFGRFLMQQVRAEDAVIRMGGDEFLILLVGRDADSVREVATRFRSAAAGSAPIRFSLGWAVREDEEPLERTVSRADRQLIKVRVAERRPRGRRRAG